METHSSIRMEFRKFIEFVKIIDTYFFFIGEGSSLRAETTLCILGVVSMFELELVKGS